MCGLATAALLLTSPVFLFQLKEPMSDVPVTAWWLIAIFLVSRSTPGLILSGGLALLPLIVTRPNLVPLAAVLGMFVLLYSAKERRTPHIECVPVFCLRSFPAASPSPSSTPSSMVRRFRPVTGGMSALFSIDYFWTNLSQDRGGSSTWKRHLFCWRL